VEGKEGRSSFLKKRTKKLFPGASHEASVSSSVSSAAGIRMAERLACEAPGKSFLVLFFKKELLP
jgi:hypothetical protein